MGQLCKGLTFAAFTLLLADKGQCNAQSTSLAFSLPDLAKFQKGTPCHNRRKNSDWILSVVWKRRQKVCTQELFAQIQHGVES